MDIRARAALFDMDGTLVNSNAVVVATWAKFADSRQLDLAEVLAFAHGRLTGDTTAHFITDPDEAAGAAAEIEAYELTHFDGIVAVPGATELLADLAGRPVAVVTSAVRDLAVGRLRAAGVPVPPVMVCAGEVAGGKPAPDGYLRAAELLHIPIADCVLFEDAEAGLQAGLASGAQVVVVGTHQSPTTAGLPRIPDFRGLSLTLD